MLNLNANVLNKSQVFLYSQDVVMPKFKFQCNFVKIPVMETINKNPVLFTLSAAAEIERLQREDTTTVGKMLRVGVKGGGCSGMTYILEFDEKKDNDIVYQENGFSFLMDKSHAIYLMGMEVNWEGGLNSRGFTFTNPNASSTCGCGTSFAV